MTTANDPWGRVDADGTVYVRTADGERVIGSWAAGSPEEALAFFRRKFESLETEVALIEQRIATTEIAPAQAQATVQRLLKSVTDANALGDLDALRARLEALTGAVDARREEVKAAREHARSEARDIKERIVEEAEHIAAEATHWKASGERMAELLEEWKAAPHADRSIEAVLWKRLSAARNAFTKRRKAYFASLEAEREGVRARKEKLVEEAESLADSTDWGGDVVGLPRADAAVEGSRAGRAGTTRPSCGSGSGTRRTSSSPRALRCSPPRRPSCAGTPPVRSSCSPRRRRCCRLPTGGPRGPRCAASRSAGSRPGRCRGSPATSWSRGCGRSRKRSGAPRKPSGSGPTPRRSPGPRAPSTSSARRSRRWSRSSPRPRRAGTPPAIRKAEEAIAARRSWLAEAERTLAEFTS